MKKIFLFFSFLFLWQFIDSSESSQKISFIWQIEEKDRWEEDWLKEIFSGVELNVISDCHYEVFMDNSIVIISSNIESEKHPPYFEKLKALNYKFGIIHLSDERYWASTEFYPYAKFVFRCYWHKKFQDQSNVWFLPLGYKAGFWKDILNPQFVEASDRQFQWCFAGQIQGSEQIQNKPTRTSMIENLKNIPNYYIHETRYWLDPNWLSVANYRDLLMDTVFVPSPMGFWNLDTFRVYEALECGSIPIVESNPIDYFKTIFGDHPFITINSWNEAPAIMLELFNDPQALEMRRQRCFQWWKDYKNNLRIKVESIIQTGFAE